MNELEYAEKTTSRMFVKEEYYKKLLMMSDFYSWARPFDIGIAVVMGHWITPYGLIQVAFLKDKCDTCANYQPKTIIGSAEL